MNRKTGFQVVVSSLAIAMGLLITPVTSYALEQGEQRREGRDIKQDARQGEERPRLNVVREKRRPGRNADRTSETLSRMPASKRGT